MVSVAFGLITGRGALFFLLHAWFQRVLKFPRFIDLSLRPKPNCPLAVRDRLRCIDVLLGNPCVQRLRRNADLLCDLARRVLPWTHQTHLTSLLDTTSSKVIGCVCLRGAMPMRRIEWRHEVGFKGWTCSDCGWIYSNPSLEPETTDHERLVRQQFEKHVCSEHPRVSGKPTDKI